MKLAFHLCSEHGGEEAAELGVGMALDVEQGDPVHALLAHLGDLVRDQGIQQHTYLVQSFVVHQVGQSHLCVTL